MNPKELLEKQLEKLSKESETAFGNDLVAYSLAMADIFRALHPEGFVHSSWRPENHG